MPMIIDDDQSPFAVTVATKRSPRPVSGKTLSPVAYLSGVVAIVQELTPEEVAENGGASPYQRLSLRTANGPIDLAMTDQVVVATGYLAGTYEVRGVNTPLGDHTYALIERVVGT